ncbi:hydrogenase maturation protease [Clostridium folliculivorans]|uniref:Hydrogenase maturation protease n=1 Tax=Clostridium folliculivorans TaxID=2886038 RepID=A0A9W5Y4W6_9CLOT|nr:hydrogenase maturation protease [Clostridium folliculivorans]GKU26502.1 hypothetical protein CFOLD11_33290 [Clostridium folliculivorans]GKU29066.1 hypothetical protein CFB3_11720 [Clostridium folliculivorans]
MIKVIGIGNILMCDDGIPMKIINVIEHKLRKLDLDIQFIKAETDLDFALDCLVDNDLIFIIDSTYFGIECGSVTLIPLDDNERYISSSSFMHNRSLVSEIKNSKFNISGFIIGIEVDQICFSLSLSKKMVKEFNNVCNKVYEIIKENCTSLMLKKADNYL